MEHLRLLSHNTFWFQGSPYPGDDPSGPVDAIFDALTAIYAKIAADVVCLQEIPNFACFERVAKTLGRDGMYSRGGEFPQYGGAILWRNGEPGDCTETTQPRFQRVWQLATVTLPSGRSLRVCNLHLASSRHLGHEEGSASRVQDMERLLKQEHDPEIIAGDFNEPPGGAVESLLASEGYVDVAPLTGVMPVSTGLNKKRSDQIWIQQSLRSAVKEFCMIGFPELRTTIAGKEFLSDHCPLVVEFAFHD